MVTTESASVVIPLVEKCPRYCHTNTYIELFAWIDTILRIVTTVVTTSKLETHAVIIHLNLFELSKHVTPPKKTT